jgi:hypothetical protein
MMSGGLKFCNVLALSAPQTTITAQGSADGALWVQVKECSDEKSPRGFHRYWRLPASFFIGCGLKQLALAALPRALETP